MEGWKAVRTENGETSNPQKWLTGAAIHDSSIQFPLNVAVNCAASGSECFFFCKRREDAESWGRLFGYPYVARVLAEGVFPNDPDDSKLRAKILTRVGLAEKYKNQNFYNVAFTAGLFNEFSFLKAFQQDDPFNEFAIGIDRAFIRTLNMAYNHPCPFEVCAELVPYTSFGGKQDLIDHVAGTIDLNVMRRRTWLDAENDDSRPAVRATITKFDEKYPGCDWGTPVEKTLSNCDNGLVREEEQESDSIQNK